ncbi:MAG: hypothetical protein ACUVV0_17395 [Anaerolineae bacterium]
MLTYPVRTVDEAYQACHPDEPLEPGDPRYVELSHVRGKEDVAARIARRVSRTLSGYHKQLVTGHRGCGKSTELKKLQANLEEKGFLAVYFDAEGTLDTADVDYLDILVNIARAVEEAARQNGLRLNRKLVKALDDWFAERILTEEQRHDVKRTLEVEFGVGAQVPLLARMLAAVTGQIASGSSRKVEIRQVLERELKLFIQYLNDLLNDISVRAIRKGKKGLVVIVDGLEKIQYRLFPDGQSSHSALFIQHADQLKAPDCHLIYTVPISLLFNANLGDAFPADPEVIPMVKITQPDEARTPYQEGRDALYNILASRVSIEDVFESPDSAWKLVEASGGSVRDLLRMMRFACDEAEKRIAPAHVEAAIRRLGREYDYLIRDEDVETLLEVARQCRAPNNDRAGRLLYLRLVMEYIDDEHGRWADVHPLVKDSPRLKGLGRR